MIIDVYKNILTISIKETYIDQLYNFFIKVNRKILKRNISTILEYYGEYSTVKDKITIITINHDVF